MSKASAMTKFGSSPAAPTTTPQVTNTVSNNSPTPKVGTTIVSTPKESAAPVEVVTPIVETPKETVDAERFANLAKKESALQKEREAIKAEKASIAEAKAKYEDVGKKFGEFETLRTKDPIAAMKLAGFSDTDIFNFYAKAQEEARLKETPEGKAIAIAQAEVKKLRDEMTTKEQQQKAIQDAAIIKKFQGKISETVTSNKDKYEFCNHYGAVAEQLIFKTIEQVLEDSGEVITPQEAADLVEEYYENLDKSMTTLKKRGYKAPETESAPKEETKAPVERSRTLSNKVAPTVASTVSKKETHEQKKERIIQNIRENGLRKS